MQGLLRLCQLIDHASERVGTVISWLTLFMVLLGAGNAFTRYGDRAFGVSMSSNAFIEAQWYMFSVLFLLGASRTLKRDQHVRVDVIYGRLPERARALIDIAGTLLFLVPFCLFGLWSCFPSVLRSIDVRERSPDPGGLPRYPLKALILVVFAMLLLQGLSLAIQKATLLLRVAPGTQMEKKS